MHPRVSSVALGFTLAIVSSSVAVSTSVDGLGRASKRAADFRSVSVSLSGSVFTSASALDRAFNCSSVSFSTSVLISILAS